MLDKLADELKEARKKTGLSLLQVSAKSKIDLKFLEAMEKGNFSFLPEIYVKAFVKDYSSIVDLDPDLMLKKYDAYKMGRNYEPPEVVKPTVDLTKSTPVPQPFDRKEPEQPAKIINETPGSHPKKRKEKKKVKGITAQETPLQTFDAVARSSAREPEEEKRKKNMVLGFAAAVVLILFILIYYLFIKSDTEIVVTERPFEEVVREKNERFSEPAAEKPEETGIAQNGDSLSLLIKANDTSWVKIILDDYDEEEFILFPRSQKIIKAGNNYKITFGNYTNIELSLNNKPLDKKNNNKSVVHVLIDSTGLKYLDAPPAID